MSIKTIARKYFPLRVLARVAYFRQFWLIGEWELRELAHLLPKPGVAIDVGANVGTYSYTLRRQGHRVISFEPDKTYQPRLRALLGPDARIEQVALSNEAGRGVMRVPAYDGDYGGGLASLSARAVPDEKISTSYDVELRTLDSYAFEEVAFIKIDVEGHEEGVLAGAAETLERCKPILLIEIEERHNPGGLDRISAYLAKFGYSGSFYHDGQRHDLSEFVAERHQVANDQINYATNRRSLAYVNNFVFAVS